MKKIIPLALALTIALGCVIVHRASAATDDLKIYQSIFDDLKKQIITKDYKWSGVYESSGIGGCNISNYFYLIRDIDSDGINELLIFTDYNKYYPYSLIAIYTTLNGEAKLVREFWTSNQGYLTVDNDIYMVWETNTDRSGIIIYTLYNKDSVSPRLLAIDQVEDIYYQDYGTKMISRGSTEFDEKGVETTTWKAMSEEELDTFQDKFKIDISIKPLPIPE